MLSEESNGVLSVVLIELWHVQVIDEVNHVDLARRTELTTGLLLEHLLELPLKVGGVRVVVEVDQLVSVVLWLLLHDFTQDTFRNLRLAISSETDHQRRVAHKLEALDEFSCCESFHRRDCDVTHLHPGSRVEVNRFEAL